MTHIGYPYYSLPFCQVRGRVFRCPLRFQHNAPHGLQPEDIHTVSANWGEVLMGELVQNSPYKVSHVEIVRSFSDRCNLAHRIIGMQIYMMFMNTCQALCSKQLSTSDVDVLVQRIDQRYMLNWLVDNLSPGVLGLPDGSIPNYNTGIPLGRFDASNGEYLIYNHHRIILKYSDLQQSAGDAQDAGTSARIVGFEVFPMSIDHRADAVSIACETGDGMPPVGLPPMIIKRASAPNHPPPTIQYSYDVIWQKSDIQWASRWDVYLAPGRQSSDVHWFSVMNSLFICIVLTGAVGMTLWRAFREDVTTYSRVVTEAGDMTVEREEPGWKLVHGDVFRPPARSTMGLTVAVGVGTQLIGTAGLAIALASLGITSQTIRGSIVLGIILSFLLSAPIGGYVAGHMHKFFDGTAWMHVALLTGLVFPACVLAVLLNINVLSWALGSSNAVGWTAIFEVLALWLFISLPLVCVGTSHGFKTERLSLPVRVESTPRHIPVQRWHMRTPVVMVLGGVPPFGTVFIESFFILTSLWNHWYYSMFGFLLIVFVLLLITAAELSIALTYQQLQAQDYRWWWRSMLIAAFSGAYFYLYCIFYYTSRLEISDAGLVSKVMYFGYMGMVAVVISLVAGAAGFLATFYFLRTLYKAKRTEILIP
jgi:transmembrane 9 superfamily protein 2/4